MSKFTYLALIIVIAATYCVSGASKYAASEVIEKDLELTEPDRHPLISFGGGFSNADKFEFTTRLSSIAMIGLEYSLDRNRNWNFEIIYYRLFLNKTGVTHDSGLLSFRRYLISQENSIRPSIHVGLGGLSLDVGAGVDFTIVKRLLYSQLCVRVPFQFIHTHNSNDEMPLMVTLNARIML